MKSTTDQESLYNFIDGLRGIPIYPCECGKCLGDKPVCPKVLAKLLAPFISKMRLEELEKANLVSARYWADYYKERKAALT